MEAPTEKLILKIWDSLVDHGLGGFLKPFQLKRINLARDQAKRKSELIAAQTKADLEKITQGRAIVSDKGQLIELASDEKGLDEILETYLNDKIQAEVNNILSTVLNAEQIALSAPVENVSTDKVNSDWVHRWINYAKESTTDELRAHWAAILVEEVKSPNNVSLRTLEVLSQLSKNEVLLFEKFCGLTFCTEDDAFVVISTPALKGGSTTRNSVSESSVIGRQLEAYDISYKKLLILREAGLLANMPEEHYEDFSILEKVNEYGGKKISIRERPNIVRAEDWVNIITLTQSGFELRRIPSITPNEKYYSRVQDVLDKSAMVLELLE